MKFSEQEKKDILDAVLKAESTTNGEIAPVIVAQSDLYPAAHFRLASLCAFLLLLANYYLEPLSDDPALYLVAFIAGSILGMLLANISLLKRLFTSRSEKDEEFKQRAYESFLLNGITETKNRNGVQLFISALEHKAMIIADVGIQKKVDNEAWQTIIDELLPYLKNKSYTHGIIKSVGSIGEVLTKHFPQDHTDEDELPNKLIIDV